MTSQESLSAVGLLDFLKCDPRPTFILDATEFVANVPVVPIYCNPAFHAADGGKLSAAITSNGKSQRPDTDPSSLYSLFAAWIHGSPQETTAPLRADHFDYCGFSWNKVTVERRWILINATSSSPNALLHSSGIELETWNAHRSHLRSNVPETALRADTSVNYFDWTGQYPPSHISPHIEYVRSFDWSQTALGPMESWSPQLRTTVNLIMQDSQPAVTFCGPNVVMIYNEAYVNLIGDLHPSCMGQSARIGLVSIWKHVEPIIRRNLAGESVVEADSPVVIHRSGFLEEAYFTQKFIPVVDEEGACIGHYETVTETTKQVLLQRRLTSLLKLSQQMPEAHDVTSYWALATQALYDNEKDVPFALVYSLESNEESGCEDISTSMSGQGAVGKCLLRGSIGLKEDFTLKFDNLTFEQTDGLIPYFRRAMHSRLPVIVRFDTGTPAAHLISAFESRAFGESCRAAVICAVRPTTSKENVLGFLVMGLNPRSPYDDDYRHFIQVASGLLSTSLMSILSRENDDLRKERAIVIAENLKNELAEQLVQSQKEVERQGLKFQRFAERSDIGIFIIGINGVNSYRNAAWYQIFQPADSDIELEDAWDELIDEEYVPLGKAKFQQLANGTGQESFELRMKRTWMAPGWNPAKRTLEEQPMWVLCSIFAERNGNGEIIEFVGCVTDISRQKWGERMQSTRALDAQESKRQLENFIDTTSHEMRNPLSAILQCADTIVQCSQHMRCIIDDVLTMSKLGSGLFIMTPINAQPEVIGRHAVKMFEGEAKSVDVHLNFSLDESWKQSGLDWVSLDPTRLLQILINLITNAIKFTKLEPIRQVSVSLGSSFVQPSHSISGQVPYNRTFDTASSPSLEADWINGELIYIHFTVQDTGRGMSESEKQLIFARFSQAPPRTHIHYGGSGLGLYISRKLTEMHGGAIGFASNTRAGSTFSFYVKGRRCRGPQRGVDADVAIASMPHSLASSTATSFTNKAVDFGPAPARATGDINKKAVPLHVLVVEDNLVNQRVLAQQLRNAGIKVAVANHGGEALEYLRTKKFCTPDRSGNDLSVILMDWEMPVMDGLTCVGHIRAWQEAGTIKRHIPVIAVTANVRSEQVKIALNSGMDDLVSKPFRIPELCEQMQRLVNSLKSIQR